MLSAFFGCLGYLGTVPEMYTSLLVMDSTKVEKNERGPGPETPHLSRDFHQTGLFGVLPSHAV